MSKISESCKKYNIQDLGEISVLESFFQNSEVAHELQEAEKYRKIRYKYFYKCFILVALFVAPFPLFSIFFIWDHLLIASLYLPMVFFLAKIIATATFHDKIEWAIKEKILAKLSKELYSKLEYEKSGKYAFGELDILRDSWFINSYDSINYIADSIGFTLEESKKCIIVQWYELRTSEGQGKSRSTTNRCYLLRAKFPDARIELKSDLLIKTDKVNSPIYTILLYWGYGLIVGIIIWSFLADFFDFSALMPIAGITGAIVCYLWTLKGVSKNRVTLENVDFEKYFDVQCADQIGSRMIVTPAFMDRLVRLARSSKYHYELLYKADRFYIKWSVGSDYLEVNTWKNIRENVDTFIAWYAQMKEILTFVFDMRLMYYAKYQADTSRPDHITEFDNTEQGNTLTWGGILGFWGKWTNL